MTVILIVLVALIVPVGWYILAGRKWLKKQPWADGFFRWIEPFEILFYGKSETLLMGRLLWIGGLFVTFYDALAVFASSLDLTPVTTRVFDTLHVPPDMRALVTSAAIGALGMAINWMRKRTTKPVELVAVAEEDITPAVANAMVVAEEAKVQAVAEVKEAEVQKAEAA